MKSVIASIMVLCCAPVLAQNEQSAEIRRISIDEFKAITDSLQDEVIIDLRTPGELRSGKIPGAVVIDFFGPGFEPAIEALDKNKIYLLYCASGGRSGETAELMRDMGFRKIYNMEEGFNGWVKRKMPVDTSDK